MVSMNELSWKLLSVLGGMQSAGPCLKLNILTRAVPKAATAMHTLLALERRQAIGAFRNCLA
jgi:hypothetical protein